MQPLFYESLTNACFQVPFALLRILFMKAYLHIDTSQGTAGFGGKYFSDIMFYEPFPKVIRESRVEISILLALQNIRIKHNDFLRDI